jgi:2-oxo-3-hexenedioate decarboxylase
VRTGTDIASTAAEALAAIDNGRQIASFSARDPGFSLDDAYRVTAAMRDKRVARGERVLGRKIGFTNRTIWAEYGVYAPMWGYVYDRTVRNIADLDACPGKVDSGFPNRTCANENGGACSLAGLAEPRIEPEVVLGLARAPSPGMDDKALIGCIEWVAHGFELVQSIFPNWKFSAADTVAANGLHGALLIGERHAVGARAGEWLRTLSAFDIDLKRNGEAVDRGRALNVMEGPLSTLRYAMDLLVKDAANPPLGTGEIITTGTLTRALPVVPGETWATELSGVRLAGISVRFS